MVAAGIAELKRRFGDERLQQKTIQTYCRRHESTVLYVHEYRLYLPGDKVRVESLGLSPNCDMSDTLNAMIKAIRDRDAEILELRRMINKLI